MAYENPTRTWSGARPASGAGQSAPPADWSGEIAPLAPEQGAASGVRPARDAGRDMERLTPAADRPGGPSASPDLRSGLPSEVITDPVSAEEVYRGSLKAMLLKYVGTYVAATFLVGTQNTTTWEGILYDVGNDYMTIYQESRDRYIVSDIYSLKFIEFYDTRCRDICDEVLRSGWTPGRDR